MCMDCGTVISQLIAGSGDGARGDTLQQKEDDLILPGLIRQKTNLDYSLLFSSSSSSLSLPPTSTSAWAYKKEREASFYKKRWKQRRQRFYNKTQTRSYDGCIVDKKIWEKERGDEEAEEEETGELSVRVITDFHQRLDFTLCSLHMEENQELKEKTIDIFSHIFLTAKKRERTKYGKRRLRRNFKQEKSFTAFSLVRALNELCIPRPLDCILRLLNVSCVKEVLDAGQFLCAFSTENNLTQDEKGPEFHVQTLCAILGIPFAYGKSCVNFIESENIRWKFYGYRPQHIAGASLKAVLNCLNKKNVSLSNIARVLNCNSVSLKRILDRLPPMELISGNSPPLVKFRKQEEKSYF